MFLNLMAFERRPPRRSRQRGNDTTHSSSRREIISLLTFNYDITKSYYLYAYRTDFCTLIFQIIDTIDKTPDNYHHL